MLEERHLSDDTDFINAEVDPNDDAKAVKAEPVEKELQSPITDFAYLTRKSAIPGKVQRPNAKKR